MRSPLSLLRNAKSATQKTLEELEKQHQKLLIDAANARQALDDVVTREAMGQKVDVKSARLRYSQLKLDLEKVTEELEEKKHDLGILEQKLPEVEHAEKVEAIKTAEATFKVALEAHLTKMQEAAASNIALLAAQNALAAAETSLRGYSTVYPYNDFSLGILLDSDKSPGGHEIGPTAYSNYMKSAQERLSQSFPGEHSQEQPEASTWNINVRWQREHQGPRAGDMVTG